MTQADIYGIVADTCVTLVFASGFVSSILLFWLVCIHSCQK